MTLHDRIMAISVACNPSGESMQAKAATLAKEADELMAEMAYALRIAAMSKDPEIHTDARATVFKYNNWKERKQ